MEIVSGPMGYPEENFMRRRSFAFLKIAEQDGLEGRLLLSCKLCRPALQRCIDQIEKKVLISIQSDGFVHHRDRHLKSGKLLNVIFL